MLTVEHCEAMALQTLGNPSALPVEFSSLEIVKRAGRWLCSAHPWTWLTRMGTVNVTGAQLFVDISTLGSVTHVVKVAFTDGATSYLRETHLSDILDYRTRTSPTGFPTLYALNSHVGTDGALTKVLELDSVPSASVTGGITILYRAGFQVPENGAASARIAVPDEWEGLFILVVRAIARGYQEEDTANVDTRLGALRKSMEFEDLKRLDGMSQSSFGQLTGGGVEMQMAGFPALRYPRSPSAS